ncbi:hypothetical protein BDW71DRAFT_6728 [Aspergillus fruticulosus]
MEVDSSMSLAKRVARGRPWPWIGDMTISHNSLDYPSDPDTPLSSLIPPPSRNTSISDASSIKSTDSKQLHPSTARSIASASVETTLLTEGPDREAGVSQY